MKKTAKVSIKPGALLSLKHFSNFQENESPNSMRKFPSTTCILAKGHLELEGEASNLAGQQNTGRFDCNFPCWELIEGLLPLINPARIGDLCPVEGRIQRQIHNPRGNAFVSPQQPDQRAWLFDG